MCGLLRTLSPPPQTQAETIEALLALGAAADTWAPDGASALMLAARADAVRAMRVLLGPGRASVELRDALGRCAGLVYQV